MFCFADSTPKNYRDVVNMEARTCGLQCFYVSWKHETARFFWFFPLPTAGL